MKYYGLIDCNNFFVSCERAFNPSLWNKPVVVLSNNDGCFVSRSQEAKELGIPMGAPFFKYKEVIKKNNVKVFSANFTLYADLSRRVMDIVCRNMMNVEVYSIDESFFTIDNMSDENREKSCRRLRDDVLKETGIPTTIGMATSKTLAKVATKYAKSLSYLDGFFDFTTVTTNDQERLLSDFELRDVWGIGSRTAEKLKREGILTAIDLTRVDGHTLKKLWNVVLYRISLELKGIPAFHLENPNIRKQSIASTRSFSEPLSDRVVIQQKIASHCAVVGRKLRSENSLANQVYLFICTNPFSSGDQFYSKGATVQLEAHTSDTREFVGAALKGFEKIFHTGLKYKKAGVILSGIIPYSSVQTSFLHPESEVNRNDNISIAIDRINQKYGYSKIRLVAEGLKDTHPEQKSMLSRKYTTSWQELLEVG